MKKYYDLRFFVGKIIFYYDIGWTQWNLGYFSPGNGNILLNIKIRFWLNFVKILCFIS